MDVAVWDAEGLVDGVAPGCYGTDFQPPMEEWKGILSKRTPVHAYMNCGRVGSQYHSLEEYRGAAANAYGAGADGIYLFNFPCFDELSSLLPRPVGQPPFPCPDFTARCWHPDITRTRQAIKELGDRQGLAHKDKAFLFYTQPPPYRHYPQEQAAIERLEALPARLVFRCYEDVAKSVGIRIEVKLVGVTVRDHFKFEMNGRPVPNDRVQRLHAPGGRDIRVHPVPLDPYSQYVITVSPDMLRRGENRLIVSLTEKEPDLLGRIEVREMELHVRY
jgi:hypothetical protein